MEKFYDFAGVSGSYLWIYVHEKLYYSKVNNQIFSSEVDLREIIFNEQSLSTLVSIGWIENLTYFIFLFFSQTFYLNENNEIVVHHFEYLEWYINYI